MPLGVFNSLCPIAMNISAWAFIVYSAGTSIERISKGKVPRFLYIYTNGAFGANFPENIQQDNEETSFAPSERYAVFILSVP